MLSVNYNFPPVGLSVPKVHLNHLWQVCDQQSSQQGFQESQILILPMNVMRRNDDQPELLQPVPYLLSKPGIPPCWFKCSEGSLKPL